MSSGLLVLLVVGWVAVAPGDRFVVVGAVGEAAVEVLSVASFEAGRVL